MMTTNKHKNNSRSSWLIYLFQLVVESIWHCSSSLEYSSIDINITENIIPGDIMRDFHQMVAILQCNKVKRRIIVPLSQPSC